MAKCANCAADAHYVYEVTDSHSIQYCQYHLPAFLNKLLKIGALKTTAEFEKAKAVALEAVSVKPSKKAAVEAVAPVAEEPEKEETEEGK